MVKYLFEQGCDPDKLNYGEQHFVILILPIFKGI